MLRGMIVGVVEESLKRRCLPSRANGSSCAVGMKEDSEAEGVATDCDEGSSSIFVSIGSGCDDSGSIESLSIGSGDSAVKANKDTLSSRLGLFSSSDAICCVSGYRMRELAIMTSAAIRLARRSFR